MDESLATGESMPVERTVGDEVIGAIHELKEMGLETAMITGDNERIARAIAQEVGIDHVVAEVLPDGKVDEIRKLQDRFGIIAMVGDGINDAPALAQTNAGIAIGTGTDIAIESSDITLVRGNLSAVITAVKLSRATFRQIKQNLFWAFIYNTIAIPFATLGLLYPVIAKIAMATSSISVVTNANMLRRVNVKPGYESKYVSSKLWQWKSFGRRGFFFGSSKNCQLASYLSSTLVSIFLRIRASAVPQRDIPMRLTMTKLRGTCISSGSCKR